MVKGKRFTDFRDTGDPVSAARIYNAQNADELVFLDIEASSDGRRALIDVIEAVSRECFMPLTVGGGVRTIDDIRTLLRAGADKVVITTAAVEDPEFVARASDIFGAQCIIGGVDVRRTDAGEHQIHTRNGTVRHSTALAAHLTELERLGAGEIFVNSIDEDGMMQGYDVALIRAARAATTLPLIVCGGAGHFQHLADGFEAGADAVACASVFHFGDNNPIRARSFLKNKGYPVKFT